MLGTLDSMYGRLCVHVIVQRADLCPGESEHYILSRRRAQVSAERSVLRVVRHSTDEVNRDWHTWTRMVCTQSVYRTGWTHKSPSDKGHIDQMRQKMTAIFCEQPV